MKMMFSKILLALSLVFVFLGFLGIAAGYFYSNVKLQNQGYFIAVISLFSVLSAASVLKDTKKV